MSKHVLADGVPLQVVADDKVRDHIFISRLIAESVPRSDLLGFGWLEEKPPPEMFKFSSRAPMSGWQLKDFCSIIARPTLS